MQRQQRNLLPPHDLYMTLEVLKQATHRMIYCQKLLIIPVNQAFKLQNSKSPSQNATNFHCGLHSQLEIFVSITDENEALSLIQMLHFKNY